MSFVGGSGPSSTIGPRRISPTRCPGGPGSPPRTGRTSDTFGHPKGEPENFLTREELKAKFDGLAAPYLGANRRDALAEALLAIDEANDVAEILRMTRPVEPESATAAGDD